MKSDQSRCLVVITIIGIFIFFSGAFSHFKLNELSMVTNSLQTFSGHVGCEPYASDISDVDYDDIDINTLEHNTGDDRFYSINVSLSRTDNPEAVGFSNVN